MAARMIDAGISAEAIVDDYIPAAARVMGAEWEGDTASFAAVTLGTAQLQSLLREIVERAPPRRTGQSRDSAIVAVPFSVQHTLGASVLAAQLRRAGLSVRVMIGAAPDAVAQAVGEGEHEIVMISASIGDPIDKVRQLVQSARAAGVPPWPKILVGGTIVALEDDIGALTGADMATMDVREALRFCDVESI